MIFALNLTMAKIDINQIFIIITQIHNRYFSINMILNCNLNEK